MLSKRKFIIVCVLALFLVMGLSNVSASADADNFSLDSTDISQITLDELSVSSVDNGASVEENNDTILSQQLIEDDPTDSGLFGATITPNNQTFSGIRDAISRASAGDTIRLSGTYTGSSTITCSKSLIFMGTNDATLQGTGSFQIMYISANNVKISGVTFKNGYSSGNAGALEFDGDNNVLDHCTFINNKCNSYGGALRVSGNNPLIQDCSFIGNVATNSGSDGGAIEWFGQYGTINRCYFEENVCNRAGGAIDFWSGTSTLANSIFVRNHNYCTSGSYGGGAIYWQTSNGVLNNCTFIENDAYFGGAVFNNGESNSFSNSQFINNTARTQGGGVWVSGSGTTFINSNLTGNSAPIGAGAFISGDAASVDNCILSDNEATGNGAGFYITGSNAIVNHCTVTNNTASTGAGFYIGGSGATVNHSIIVNNTATTGAGVYINNQGATVNNSRVSSNKATGDGAGFYINGANAQVLNSNLTENEAYRGAGFYINGNNAIVSSVNIINNTATSGAGLYIYGSVATISNAEISNNTATTGAGLYIAGSNAQVISSDITDNEASSNGAGIYIQGDYATVNGGDISNNNATNGAGVYIDGNHATVQNVEINNNTADLGAGVYIHGYDSTINNIEAISNVAKSAGAVYVNGSNSQVTNSRFIDNNATVDGGAVYIVGSNTLFENDYFYKNNAIPDVKQRDQGCGGAVYIDGNGVDVKNTTFSLNTARNGSAIYMANHTDNVKIYEDTINLLDKNQAWVYDLPINFNSTTKDITSVLYGGNNILNAFYNSKDISIIQLEKDGVFSNPQPDVEHSQQGALYYQDSREPNQNVNITVYDVNRNQISNGSTTTDLYGRAIVNAAELGDDAYFVEMYHAEDPSYKPITNITAINFVDGILVANTNFTYANATELWAVYKINDGPVPDVNLTFYARNLDTNVTYKLGTVETGSGGEAYLKDLSVLNTLDVAKNNYELIVQTLVGTKGNATLMIFPRNASITNDSNTIYHGQDTNLTIDLIDWYDGSPIVNRTVVVIVYDENGTVVRTSSVISDANSQIHVILSNLDVGNYTVGTIFNTTLSYNDCANVSSVEVLPSPKLNITKVLETIQDHYVIGDYLNWTITVTNVGDTLAHLVQVEDLSSSLGLYSYEARNGTFVNGIWTIGDLDVGGVVILKLTTIITDSNVVAWNFVNVTTSDYDNPYDTNKSQNVTIDVWPDANVTISKTVNATGKVASGDLVEWTITVNHVSGDPLKDVSVSDLLSTDKLRIISWNAPTGTVFDNNTRIWSITNLNSTKNSYTLKLVTQVLVSNQNITNVAIVTYNGTNGRTNSSNATIDVLPSSNMQVDKVIVNPKDYYIINDTIYWTITVENVGDNDATGVKVTDLSEGLTIIGYNATVGTFTNGVWDIGTLAVNTPVTLNITTKVTKSGAVDWNYVKVTTTAHDNPNNNKTRNVTVTVLPDANVTVNKVVNGSSIVGIGDNVTWVITVEHVSGDPLTNVVVTDSLPTGLTIVDSTVPAGTSFDGLVWTINALNSTKNKYVLVLITKVLVSDVNLTNGVVVSYNGTNSRTNSSNATVTILPNADISVTKSVNASVVVINDTVKWTIVVSNNGTDDIYGINVTDTLPDGLTNIVAVNGTVDGNIVSWTIDLANGTSKTLTITAKVVTSGKDITNRVGVEFNGTDPDYSNNNASVNITVKPNANVTIDKYVDGPSVVGVRDNVTWVITVDHVSGDPLKDVSVSDLLPDTLRIISWNAPTGTVFNNTTKTWTITNLDSTKNSYTLRLVTKLLVSDQDITNVATVTYNGTNVGNNVSDATVIVLPDADISVTKSVNASVVVINNTVTWTIVVSNNGPDDITGINVTDTLPDGLTNIVAVNGSINGNIVSWTIDLANGTSKTLTIVAKVVTSGKDITNRVGVEFNGTDPDYSNNNASVDLTIKPNANVTISKVINGPNVVAIGDNVTWVITVEHVSGDPLDNINVTDTIPTGLEIVDTTVPAGTSFDNSTGIWTISTLNIKTNIYELIIVTKVLESDVNLTNGVVVTYNGTNERNNKANATVTVLPHADIAVTLDIDKNVVVINNTVTWTINVTNNGPDDITGINVTDVLPDGLTDISAPNGTVADNVVSWTIDVANGTSKTLTITAKVVTSGKDITNRVGVEFNGTDPDYSNNNASVNLTIKPNANVTINKVVNGSSIVGVGDNVTWVITVEHVSGDPLTNVNVTEYMPDALQIVNSTVPNGTSFDGSLWTIDALNATNNKYELIIVTKVLESDVTLTNGVVVSYNGTNERTDNSNASIIVLANADIIVHIQSDSPEYVINNTIRWTVIVSNNGPDDINCITITDILPKGLIDIDVPGLLEGNVATWNISLAKGETKSFDISAIIKVSGVNLVNNVSVQFNGTDPDPSTNNDSLKVIVLPDAIVNITKVINGSSVVGIGDNVTWIITVDHTWGDNLTNVTVSEIIPDGLEIVDKTVPKGSNYNETSGIWTIDDLNAQASAYELVLVTKVLVSNTNITNIVNVTYNGTNTGRNETNVTLIVLPHADVEISVDVIPNETQIDGNLTWVINVVNYGVNDTAPLVNVTITLPEGVELTNVTLPNGTTFDNETGIWSIPELAVGQNLTINLLTKVNVTNTTLTTSANVTFNGTNPSNKTMDNVTANILPSVDLNVNVTFDQDKVYVGDEVKVTVVLDNFGPDIADNTNVTIIFPDTFEIKSFNSTNGTYIPENNTWYVGNITPGQYILEIIGVFTQSGNFNVTVFVNTTTPIAINAIGNLTSVDNITVEDVPVNGIGMLRTGNPLLVALLALLLIPVRLRRK